MGILFLAYFVIFVFVWSFVVDDFWEAFVASLYVFISLSISVVVIVIFLAVAKLAFTYLGLV